MTQTVQCYQNKLALRASVCLRVCVCVLSVCVGHKDHNDDIGDKCKITESIRDQLSFEFISSAG